MLKLEDPVRLGGFAAILAGVLLVVSDLLRLYVRNVADADTVQYIFFVDGWVGMLLAVVVQLGLVGLYAPKAKAIGVVGVIGLVIAFVGIMLTRGASFT